MERIKKMDNDNEELLQYLSVMTREEKVELISLLESVISRRSDRELLSVPQE